MTSSTLMNWGFERECMMVFSNAEEIAFLPSSSSNPNVVKWQYKILLSLNVSHHFLQHLSVALYSILPFWITVEWTYSSRCIISWTGSWIYTVTQCRFQVVFIWFLCIPVRRLSLSFFCNDWIASVYGYSFQLNASPL